MVKIKICGITNLKDALAAVRSGCSALGFIFYKKSPRYIAPPKAKNIIGRLPKTIKKVGVFVNAGEKEIRRTARLCRLDMLQFHGSESPEFCARFKDYKVIKAFRIKHKINFKNISRYKTFAYLFDAFMPSKPGGTGRHFDWHLLRRRGNLKRPIFLSGGLNEDNVKQAIEIVCPDWVDVSTSIEIRPGKKDLGKLRRFIKAARCN